MGECDLDSMGVPSRFRLIHKKYSLGENVPNFGLDL
jgi:hypothetical protein